MVDDAQRGHTNGHGRSLDSHCYYDQQQQTEHRWKLAGKIGRWQSGRGSLVERMKRLKEEAC